MNHDVAAYLRCPVCREQVNDDGPALRCGRGHTFDIARQGYVNLTAGLSPHSGDTPQMVADREAFLSAGHYEMIMAAVVREAMRYATAGLIVDAGTGTGQYLEAVLDALPDAVGLGLDVSKPALRRAARIHPRAGAACADLWRTLPVADASAALILNVFAPRNGPEFRRVLAPGGAVLTVTPAADHLAELIEALGLLRVDPEKADRVARSLGDGFTAASTTHLRRMLSLTAAEVRTLVGMGPSAWHGEVKLDDAPRTVTASVDLTVWTHA